MKIKEFQQIFNQHYSGEYKVLDTKDGENYKVVDGEGEDVVNDIYKKQDDKDARQISRWQVNKIFSALGRPKDFPFIGFIPVEQEAFLSGLRAAGIDVEDVPGEDDTDSMELELRSVLGELFAVVPLDDDVDVDTEEQIIGLNIYKTRDSQEVSLAELNALANDLNSEMKEPVFVAERLSSAFANQASRFASKNQREALSADEIDKSLKMAESKTLGTNHALSMTKTFRRNDALGLVARRFISVGDGELKRVESFRDANGVEFVSFEGAKIVLDALTESVGIEDAEKLKERLFDYEDGGEDKLRYETKYENQEDPDERRDSEVI